METLLRGRGAVPLLPGVKDTGLRDCRRNKIIAQEKVSASGQSLTKVSLLKGRVDVFFPFYGVDNLNLFPAGLRAQMSGYGRLTSGKSPGARVRPWRHERRTTNRRDLATGRHGVC